PFVGTRLRDGGDDCARRLLVFGLEVARRHAELLHGISRKRIPATRILTCDSTLNDVVLVARAVDEDVHLLGGLRPGGERLAVLVNAIFGDPYARSEHGEIQEVSTRRWKLLDLRRR